MRLYIALTVLTLSAASATAQPAQPPKTTASPDGAMLNITAEGRTERRPDLATFSAGVVTQARTAGEAMRDNSARMNALVGGLKRSAVADRDIQTSTVAIQPQYHYPQPPARMRQADGTVITEPAEPQAPRIVGYEARNTVSVRVRRIEDLGKIIDVLVEAGANQVDGPYFSLEHPEQAADEARADALRTARSRAELYAREGGFRRARLVSITEGGGYYPVVQQVAVVGRGMGVGAPPPAPPPPPPAPVQPGEVSVGLSLSVQFVLEP